MLSRIASGEMAIIALVLLASVAVAGVLGYQAHVASRENVETARRALAQYSAVAAWQFARNAQREMQVVADRTIGMRVQHATHEHGKRPGELLTPAEIRGAVPRCDCKPAPMPVEQFFRWDVGTDDLLTEGGLSASERRALAARLATDALDPNGDRHLSSERLAADLTSSADRPRARWSHANCDLLVDRGLDGSPRLLAIAAAYDDAQRLIALYGAIVTIDQASAVFVRAAARESLLPTALLSSAAQDSAIAIDIVTGQRSIFSRGPVGSAEFVAVDSLGSATFATVVRAGLSPTVVNRLLIGGLPRSRLPLIGLFLGLSLVLLVVALRQMRRALQLGRLRSDFVSSVSHELRTPLSLVKVYTETLIDDETVDREQRGRFLGVILKETNRLGRLVENLLRFAELERRNVSVTPVLVDLGATLHSAVADFRPLAENNSIDLDAHVATGIGAVIDPVALRQIVFNLLTNAVKFGAPGTRVTVTLERVTDRALIYIDDQGPGIPASQRARVFDRYVRLAQVATGGPAGSGIGLAIVRELAHAQRMSVWIDDSPLGGTRVVLSIPTADAPAPTDEPLVVASVSSAV
jgi:signal transduction histidine kinase